jgi:hypothetical protein
LHALQPDLPLLVISDLLLTFFRNRLDPQSVRILPGAFDAGMVQLDSIRVDVGASLEKVLALCANWTQAVATHAGFLRTRQVSCVVADIPAIPLESAAQIGIPGIAVGNFGWDWIYSGFVESDPRWSEAVRAFAAGYGSAGLLLRLPFAEPMRSFRTTEDVPVVASRGRERRGDISDLYGADPGRKWVLISFASLDWNAAAISRVEGLSDYEFFTVRPLEWHGTRIRAVDREEVSFSDLVASVDCAVSKPGFGIVSDCVANSKPLIFAERTDFLEYGVLEAAIRRYLKHVHIPGERLYEGDLAPSLERIWEQPEPRESIPCGGAEQAARRILDFAGP